MTPLQEILWFPRCVLLNLEPIPAPKGRFGTAQGWAVLGRPFGAERYSGILYSPIFLYRVLRLIPRMEAVLTLLPPVTFKTWVK